MCTPNRSISHAVKQLTPSRHKSIISYLEANNLSKASGALRLELGLDDAAFDSSMTKKYETLLEKKWTSVIRLQKKVGQPRPAWCFMRSSHMCDAHRF